MSGSIGGIDASIPLRAGQGVAPPPNPLAQYAEYANLQGALNRNALFPGQQQLQQQAIQANDLALAKARLEQTQQRVGAFNSAIGPLLSLGDQVTQGDVLSTVARLHSQGFPTDEIVRGMAADMPVISPADMANPDKKAAYQQQLAQYVRNNWGQNIPAAAQADIFTPGPAAHGAGGQTLVGTVGARGGPNPGAFTPQQKITHSVSPEYRATPQTRIDADNTPVTAPGEATAPPSTLEATITPVGQSSMGTGRYSSDVPGAGGAPSRGASPGTIANLEASATGAHEANVRARTFASDMYPLQKAQASLAGAPTGKGSETVHNFSSYLSTFAPAWVQKSLSFISPTMTKDEVTAYDEAKKYLTQVALGAPGATRSNEGLSTAGAANPSTGISKEAAQVVVRGMIGLRRMEQDATLAFNNSGLPASGYDKFITQFTTKADPRVYTFDQMTPQERKQTLDGIKDVAKRRDFMRQVDQAESNGVISAPGAANGQ